MTPRRVLAVASGKGGVGKTTVAVGLALALAQEGLATGLLDADLYGPDVPRMLGLTRTTDATSITLAQAGEQRPEPVQRYGLKVWSTQFLVSERQPLALQSPLAGLLLNRAFKTVNWGELDWLVVDLPPGTADVQQVLVNELRPQGALLVVTPQDIAHLDAKKVHALFVMAKVAVLGGVENMASFACPCCGAAIELFPPTSDERTIWALGVRRLARVPFNAAMARAAELGRPLLDTESNAGGVFQDLARTIVETMPPPR